MADCACACSNGKVLGSAWHAHLNLCGFEVLAEHILQRGNGRLHGLLKAELWVVLEALLQEVVGLLVLCTCAGALQITNQSRF